MSNPIRLAVTAISGRVIAGRQTNPNGQHLRNYEDVTSDFMKAVIDKATYHGGSFDIEGAGGHWDVVVTRREATGSKFCDHTYHLGTCTKCGVVSPTE